VSEAIIKFNGGRQLHAKWIVDSGATWHMTSNREWFYTYKPISGGSMFMGDGHAVKIVGVGTVKIKMYDGIVRTIQKVRHVKDLKKNILSIGQLDDLRYKIHTEGGILKVARENMVVMKAEKIMVNLYVLMWDTLQEVNATVASTSQEELVMMRHCRLQHMSEQGLQILGERNILPELKKGWFTFLWALCDKQTT